MKHRPGNFNLVVVTGPRMRRMVSDFPWFAAGFILIDGEEGESLAFPDEKALRCFCREMRPRQVWIQHVDGEDLAPFRGLDAGQFFHAWLGAIRATLGLSRVLQLNPPRT